MGPLAFSTAFNRSDSSSTLSAKLFFAKLGVFPEIRFIQNFFFKIGIVRESGFGSLFGARVFYKPPSR